MQTAEFLVADPDQNRIYNLEVHYDVLPAEPEVGYGGGFEINRVKCLDVSILCGKFNTVTVPLDSINRTAIGAWCQANYREEIETNLKRFHDWARDDAIEARQKARAERLERMAECV